MKKGASQPAQTPSISYEDLRRQNRQQFEPKVSHHQPSAFNEQSLSPHHQPSAFNEQSLSPQHQPSAFNEQSLSPHQTSSSSQPQKRI